MKKNTLINYIKGELINDQDIADVRNWILKSEQNADYFANLKNIIALSSNENNQLDIDNELMVLKKRMANTFSAKKIFIRISRYAAVLLILVGFSWFIYSKFSPNYEVVTCPLGKTTQHALSDGTSIWLNSGSTLQYPTKFDKVNREVKLTGEAFFDVKSDKEHPFVVKTDALNVIVTGTKFNISAYPDDNNIKTSLIEGKVLIRVSDKNKTIELTPGEMAEYSSIDKNIMISEFDNQAITSWMQGKLYIRNERFDEIVKKLERWYDVNITIESDELNDIKLSCTVFKDKPVEQVLDGFSLLDERIKYYMEETSNGVEITIANN